MNFNEAVAFMKQNKFVARVVWDAEKKYCCILPGMKNIFQVLTVPNPNVACWLPSVEDFLAQDWIEIVSIEGPKPVETEAPAQPEESVAA
jgi:hypothetical protein